VRRSGKKGLGRRGRPDRDPWRNALRAGALAAHQHGAAELVDPRPFAVGTLKSVFEAYPHLNQILPAEGYFPEQLKDMEATIQRTPCDLVLVATPIDLSRLIKISQPVFRVSYRVEDWGKPTIGEVIEEFIQKKMPIEVGAIHELPAGASPWLLEGRGGSRAASKISCRS